MPARSKAAMKRLKSLNTPDSAKSVTQTLGTGALAKRSERYTCMNASTQLSKSSNFSTCLPCAKRAKAGVCSRALASTRSRDMAPDPSVLNSQNLYDRSSSLRNKSKRPMGSFSS